jgi:hypothetical protein
MRDKYLHIGEHLCGDVLVQRSLTPRNVSLGRTDQSLTGRSSRSPPAKDDQSRQFDWLEHSLPLSSHKPKDMRLYNRERPRAKKKNEGPTATWREW